MAHARIENGNARIIRRHYRTPCYFRHSVNIIVYLERAVTRNCPSARNLSFMGNVVRDITRYNASVQVLILGPCARVHLANGVNYWYLEGVSRGVTRWRSRCEITWNVSPSFLRSLSFPTPSLVLSLSILVSLFFSLHTYISSFASMHRHKNTWSLAQGATEISRGIKGECRNFC